MVRFGRGEASNYHAVFPRKTTFAPGEYDLLLERRHRSALMKIFSALIAACLIGAGAFAAEPPKESDRDQQQLAALAKEVQGQQTAIADNQKKIDEKLAAIAEAIRQARLYSARGR
jgi:hypothetical protein